MTNFEALVTGFPVPTAEDVIDGNTIKDVIWEILIDVDRIIDKYISGKENNDEKV